MSGVFQFSYDRFPYKWENGTIFFKESADYWTPVFVEKSIKINFKFLILPSPIDRHDNQVGRWLTNFRATWDPKFDSYAVVGSMKQPRQVRLSEVCSFSIVWSLHVKSNVNGWSTTQQDFLFVTLFVTQFTINLVIIMNAPNCKCEFE